MKVSASFTCLTTTGDSSELVGFGGGQSDGLRNTTTSPRCGLDPNQGVSLSTSTRSPIRMVCSIDPEGITKACTRNVLRNSAMSSATVISSGISRTADLRRLRFTLRASLRRSARVGSERALAASGAAPP